MRDIRRAVVALVIGSCSLAALMGVLALLVGGFGETEARILATTVVVGVESVAMLCYLAVAGRRTWPVGVVGALVSLVATGSVLLLVWAESADQGTTVVRLMGVSVTLAATLAQVSLLLRAAGRPGLRGVLAATVALAGAVAGLVCWMILRDGDVGAGFVKLLGVLGILDVLGSVVLVAVAVAGSRRTPGTRPPAPTFLAPDTWARIAAAAADRGTTPDLLVGRALDALGAE